MSRAITSTGYWWVNWVTRSAVPGPKPAIRSAATERMAGRSRSTARGVKARTTSLRSRAWGSSSWVMIRPCVQ